MRIGLLGAMPEEVALLQEDLALIEETSVGGRVYRSGTLYGRDVVLAHSRMGKVAAAATVTHLLESCGVDAVVFTGVAGAVAKELSIGDIVIGSALLQHDLDASPLFPRYEIPLLGVSHIVIDPDLVDGASEAALRFVHQDMPAEVPEETRAALGLGVPKVVSGLIASGDRFIDDFDAMLALRREVAGIQCVEMEGAAVAQVCLEHGVPCLVIRTISDRADAQAGVDFPLFVERVARYYSRGIVRRLFELF